MNVEATTHRMAAIKTQTTQLAATLNAEAVRLSDEAKRLEEERRLVDEKQVAGEEALEKRRKELVADVAAERALLDAQRAAAEQVRESQESHVTLNVGGHRFTTSRTLFARWPGSFLEVMFSGRHVMHTSDDGSYFIDRDGAHFGHVLDYMRDDERAFPRLSRLSEECMQSLVIEADFFGLPSLCEMLQGRGYMRSLTDDDRMLRETEEVLRSSYHALPAFVVPMRNVLIGTFDCGACEVAFVDGSISFVPAIAIPDGPEAVVLQTEKLVKTEFDQGRGALCLLGSWSFSQVHFTPYLPSGKYSSARHRVVFFARDHDAFKYIPKSGGRHWDLLELMQSFPALKRGPQKSCVVDKDFMLQRELALRSERASGPSATERLRRELHSLGLQHNVASEAHKAVVGTMAVQILEEAQAVANPVPDLPFKPQVARDIGMKSDAFSYDNSSCAYQSISAMLDYAHLSFEEIRLHQCGYASLPPPAGASVATSRTEAGSSAATAPTPMPATPARTDASADEAGSASAVPIHPEPAHIPRPSGFATAEPAANSCTPDAPRVARRGLFDGLVEVFPAAEGLVREEPSCPYTTLFAEYAKLENHISVGQRPIVDNHDAFVARFTTLYPNILSRLQGVHETEGCGWFLGGGAVLRALLRRSWPAQDGDVDVFVYATTGSTAERQKKATALAKRVFDALARDGEPWSITRSKHVINLRRGPAFVDETTIQIVLRLYQSPAEVLLGFDVDCCCVGFDGYTVRALPRALRALRLGYVVCNPLHSWPNQPTYELRLAKYASRGFAVAVPGLNLAEIDLLQATSQGSLSQLRGVARLLLLHTDLLHRVKNAETTGDAIPTLRRLYGEMLIYTGYGPGAHDVCRTLPDEDDEERLLNSWYFTASTVPGEDLDRPDSTNASASRLVNPQNEEDFDDITPVMDATARNELWRYILDSFRDNMQVPRRLEWATTPRSREYLNAKEANLDHSYFASAYPPYGAEGERLARERNPFSAPRPLPLAAAGPETPAIVQSPAAQSPAAQSPAAQSPAVQAAVVAQSRAELPFAPTLNRAPRTRPLDDDTAVRSLANDLNEALSAAAVVAVVGAGADSDDDVL